MLGAANASGSVDRSETRLQGSPDRREPRWRGAGIRAGAAWSVPPSADGQRGGRHSQPRPAGGGADRAGVRRQQLEGTPRGCPARSTVTGPGRQPPGGPGRPIGAGSARAPALLTLPLPGLMRTLRPLLWRRGGYLARTEADRQTLRFPDCHPLRGAWHGSLHCGCLRARLGLRPRFPKRGMFQKR